MKTFSKKNMALKNELIRKRNGGEWGCMEAAPTEEEYLGVVPTFKLKVN